MEMLLRKKMPWEFIQVYFDEEHKISITPSQTSEPVKLTLSELEDVIIHKRIKRSSQLYYPPKK